MKMLAGSRFKSVVLLLIFSWNELVRVTDWFIMLNFWLGSHTTCVEF